MRAIIAPLVLLTLLVVTAPAQAVISFDLTTDWPQILVDDEFTFTEDGVTLTTTGTAGGQDANVIRSPFGMGVISENTSVNSRVSWRGVLTNSNVDFGTVDGFRNEVLTLTFDTPGGLPFQLLGLCFNGVDFNDALAISVDGGTPILFGPDQFGPALPLPNLPAGNVFHLSAPTAQSAWYLTKAHGEVIPEPSTALIWMALGTGVVLWRRRRRKCQRG